MSFAHETNFEILKQYTVFVLWTTELLTAARESKLGMMQSFDLAVTAAPD